MRRLSGRLSARLVASHAVVALLGAVATFVIVRTLAPPLFDQSMRMGTGGFGGGFGTPGGGMGQGGGPGAAQALRTQFASAVDQALLVGALVGVVAATVLGVVLAHRLVRPIAALRRATDELARGRYEVAAPASGITELAELASDVNSLGRQLAETEARRVRLLGEVAHELRTPLTVIDGYVEGMIDGVLPTTASELGQVSEEVRRLRRLADDLSALSRAEEGRLGLALRDVDLSGVASTAAERMRPQFEDAGVTLVVANAGAADALPTRADPDRIAQVVTNLLGNALRATPPGGRVTLRTSRVRDRATVAVTDTGEGLAEADLERVFERFYRVPGRRADAHDTGSGIGLTIARGIARAHGGDLVAASDGPGRGATFTLELPAGG